MANQTLFRVTREVLVELLTCPLCFERYDGRDRFSKYLPCLHGFCVVCLGRLVGDEPVIQCPICRQDTDVPAAGVRDFPDNFIVAKLVDLHDLVHVLDVDLTQPHGLRCGLCIKDGGIAVSFCSHVDCLAFLCTGCALAHRTMQPFQNHVVSSMEELQNQPGILLPAPRSEVSCEQHRQQSLILFCDEEHCQKAICIVCSATDHKNHRAVDLDQKSAEVKMELQSLAEVAGSKKGPVEEISGRISSEINNTNVLFTEMSAAVSAAIDDIQTQLEKRKDAVISELRKMCVNRTDHLRCQIDRTESLASQLDSARQFSEKACGIGNPVDLLKTREQIIKRLHELIALDIDAYLPFRPAGEAFLSFGETHKRALSEIEKHVAHLWQFDASTGDGAFGFTVDFPGKFRPCLAVKSTHKVRIRINKPTFLSNESIRDRLHAFLQSPGGSSVDCKESNYCNGAFEFDFQPLVTGLHRLNISMSGEPIAGSPFQVDVVDGHPMSASVGDSTPLVLDSDNPKISSDVTWADAFVKCEHTIIVKFRGPSPVKPCLNMTARYTMPDYPTADEGTESIAKAGAPAANEPENQSPKLNESEATITNSEEEGAFLVTYTPPAPGTLLMTIVVDGTPIGSSPFVIRVNPLHLDSTLVFTASMGECYQNAAALDMPCSVRVQTRDHKRKSLTFGGYDVTASVATQSSPGKEFAYDVKDNQDGSYTITFTPCLAEQHIVRILICGHPVNSERPLLVPVQDSLSFKNPPSGYMFPSGMAVDKDRGIVYVADARNGCIHRFPADDGSSPIDAINITQRSKSLQAAVNTAGKITLLEPSARRVTFCGPAGEEESRWSCTAENVTPANITVSSHGNVIVGDRKTQSLFIYRPHGENIGRIQLPEGSLAVGMSNVCSDYRTNDIIVATHAERLTSASQSPFRPTQLPFRILRFDANGDKISDLHSPATSNQLAAASTPEGVLLVAQLGKILILEFDRGSDSLSVVKEFQTDHIYTQLEFTGKGCFVAFDPGEKHLAKYCYRVQGSPVGRQEEKEATNGM